MNPNALFPKAVNGVTYTVSALRHQIIWEPWSALIVNGILAAVMAGLAVWGKRNPLTAVLIATATYVVVIATNAILNPLSIGHGIYIKMMMIAFLVRGIKGAMVLRTANG